MRSALFAFLLVCASATPAAADRFGLHYQASTLGIVSLGAIVVDADLSPDGYQIDATLESGGLLRWFQPTTLSANATGTFTDGAVHWGAYDLDHHYNKKHRVTSLRAGPDGAITAEITPNYRLWGTPPATEEQRRRSRDPLSTVMAMAVDVNLTHRCAGEYPAFDGRFHYLLELAGGEVAHFEGGGYDGPVLKCSLAYIPVAGFERSDRGRIRIPHGEVWFALVPDSLFGPPVRIITPLAAGGATIRLTEWHRVTVDVNLPPTP